MHSVATVCHKEVMKASSDFDVALDEAVCGFDEDKEVDSRCEVEPQTLEVAAGKPDDSAAVFVATDSEAEFFPSPHKL